LSPTLSQEYVSQNGPAYAGAHWHLGPVVVEDVNDFDDVNGFDDANDFDFNVVVDVVQVPPFRHGP
jgi:hypothetical protein